MANEVRLTTVDNPYDPFKEWDKWLSYDMQMGYYTCEKVATVCGTSSTMPDEQIFNIMDDSLNDLIAIGCLNKYGKQVEYKKVYKFPTKLNKSDA